jgi:4-hydroxy-tetrahydrodipicolinate synthase
MTAQRSWIWTKTLTQPRAIRRRGFFAQIHSTTASPWAPDRGNAVSSVEGSSNVTCRPSAPPAPPPPPALRGVFPVLITPFHDDQNESIDLEGFRRCISFMYEVGCNGVTIAGVLGESNRMTDLEKQLLMEAAVDEVNNRNNKKKISTLEEEDPGQTAEERAFHLCLGMTHSGTAATVALCQMAAEAGADAVMVSPTRDAVGGGPQPTDNDIFHLFERIADACPRTSIVLQDLPPVSGVHLSIALISRILSHIPQVTTVKLESLPTIHRLVALREGCPDLVNIPFSILTGLGALYSGFDLQGCHSDGFMTGFAFPEILLVMTELAQSGRYDEVHRVYQKYLPLIVLEQQPVGGLAIRKEIYRLRGLISSSHIRHPGNRISSTMEGILKEQLIRSCPELNITRPILRDVIVQ